MKKYFTLILILFASTTFGQKMTPNEWDEMAKTDKRLLPKYGHLSKSEEEKKADAEFIQIALKQDTTKQKASNHLISLGFNYLYKGDLKTAMSRFNQAYLLDSTNTDIYWGFGGVYLTLGNLEKAKAQYITGLSINPKNTHLLSDYGTYFLSQYYGLKSLAKNDASKNLDSAIVYLNKSYKIDAKDQNTAFKLSVCYLNKNDCNNSWKYYDICKSLGGRPINEDYTNALKNACKR